MINRVLHKLRQKLVLKMVSFSHFEKKFLCFFFRDHVRIFNPSNLQSNINYEIRMMTRRRGGSKGGLEWVEKSGKRKERRMRDISILE